MLLLLIYFIYKSVCFSHFPFHCLLHFDIPIFHVISLKYGRKPWEFLWQNPEKCFDKKSNCFTDLYSLKNAIKYIYSYCALFSIICIFIDICAPAAICYNNIPHLISFWRNMWQKAFVIIFTCERLWFIVEPWEASCHFQNPLNVTESIFLPTCEDQAESKFAVVS